MRSILALCLALLVLGAETSGSFLESPVCAAVDGVAHAVARKPAGKATPSCCGSPTCPMHASGCGKASTCPMEAAASWFYGILQLPVHQRINGINLVSDLNLYFGVTRAAL